MEFSRADSRTEETYRIHGYWLPVELHERLKNAWWWTRVEVDGVPTFGALMERIMRGECVRLEGAYRGGERFEAAPKNARGVKPDASKRQSEKLIARWALIRQEEQNGPKNP